MAATSSSVAGVYQNRHSAFVKSFVQKRSQGKNEQKILSAGERAVHRKELAQVLQQSPLAEGTKINVACALRRWNAQVYQALYFSWEAMIKEIDCPMMQDHLDWMCNTLNIKSSGTSWEYWRQFKQLYENSNGRRVDTNASREVKKYHDNLLVPFYELQPPNADGKEVVGLRAAQTLLVFNIARDTRAVPHERRRAQNSTIALLLGFTGGRSGEFVNNERKRPPEVAQIFGPAAFQSLRKPRRKPRDDEEDEDPDEESHLLTQMVVASNRNRGRPKALCYEDILLTVVRDPDTHRDVHVLVVKLIHHKGEDRKPKPTIYFLLSSDLLIFCVVTHIVGLALDDNAFDSPHLTSAERVFGVKNQAPAQCTPLRWKKAWLKKPVFRRVDGSGVSPDEALAYHTLNEDIKHASLEAGMQRALTARAWRRWRANGLNGEAPDAVRDQVMRHDPRWTTFFGAYLNMAVQWDLVNSTLQKDLQNKLILELTQVGIWHDPRATKDMVPDEVWKEMPPNPEIEALRKRKEELKGGSYRIAGKEHEEEVRSLTKRIRQLEAKERKDVCREYREDYFQNRPTWDIDRQFGGEAGETDEDYTAPAIELRIPERAELARLLCYPVALNDEEIRQRRIRVADLWSALCKKQEKADRTPLRIRRRPRAVPVEEKSPKPDPFPLLMSKTQCPECIGNQGLTIEERTFSYCRPAVMNDHFEDSHLESIQKGGDIICKHPKCKNLPPLTTVDHFRIHVERVHNVTLRSAQNATARRDRKMARRRNAGGW
ncbi:hypothetical protein C8A05DRAFT_47960 [Staphylotrichum tortipilum]|uniref:FluG domain-containing protein n=1 Tax=Staphylotrichum tortipilum TaxID=2831512 RepID=A0AAN6MCG4_9PEZI|nr:hypothetical protein C8A05DRAFT_47960 [Staphylotrichum longicolle]